MLKSYNPPLGFLFEFLSKTVPLFSEIFRYTFTKWICTAIFAYSILFGFGGGWLMTKVEKFRFRSFAQHGLRVVLALSLLLAMFPVFHGQIFSTANQLKIPSEYFAVMKYFKTQPKYARIATFPQYAFWGWDVHTWGYRGSGWWRHGIEQPLLERTHDVWAKENEQYYQEISTALYTENVPLFSSVMRKYQVGWLLIDHSLDYGKDKHIAQLKIFAEESKLFAEPIQFGTLTVYPRVDINQVGQTYFSSKPVVHAPTTYVPDQQDQLYTEYGDYIKTTTPFIMPLFDHNSIQNMKRNDGFVSYTQKVNLSGKSTLTVPNYFKAEKTVPSSLEVKREENTIFVKVKPKLPSIQVGGQSIELVGQEKELEFPVSEDVREVLLRVNDTSPAVLTSLSNSYQEVNQLYLSTQEPNSIAIYNASPSAQLGLSDAFFTATAEQCGSTPGEIKKELFENRTFSLQAIKTLGCVTVKPSGVDSTQLSEFQFEAKSSTTERPLVIAKDSTTNQVLNKDYVLETSFTQDWKNQVVFIDPIENAQPNTLELSLALDAMNDVTTQSISYRNMLLKQYPPLGKSTVQFTTNNPTVDTAEQTVSLDQNITSVDIRIPVISSKPAGFYTSNSQRFKDLTKNCDAKNTGPHDKKVIDNAVEYSARNASECDAWDYSQSQSHVNYLLETKTQNFSGRPLQICLSHTATNRCSVQELLADTASWATQFFPVRGVSSPGNSYVLQINNLSIGRIETRNRLEYANLYPYPLDWLEKTFLTQDKEPTTAMVITRSYAFNSALHFVEVEKPVQDAVIALSQTFDPGWLLFRGSTATWGRTPLPEQFGLGQRIGKHYELNSWQNSWLISKNELPSSSEKLIFIAVFWPAALQLLGWVLFFGFVVLLTSQLITCRNS
jgi:hypothetical protein